MDEDFLSLLVQAGVATDEVSQLAYEDSIAPSFCRFIDGGEDMDGSVLSVCDSTTTSFHSLDSGSSTLHEPGSVSEAGDSYPTLQSAREGVVCGGLQDSANFQYYVGKTTLPSLPMPPVSSAASAPLGEDPVGKANVLPTLNSPFAGHPMQGQGQ
jgi:hypothetical protein